jgi:RNA chaperone Hfq
MATETSTPAAPTKQERQEARQDQVANRWLDTAKGHRITVRYLDGHEVVGRLQGWDRYTLMIENEGRSTLVMKHAVATLSPA